MSGRVQGKVAFVTGAARGQGRSHAVRLAQEGADIIAVDLCGQVASVPYPAATEEDLRKTGAEVESLGRRVMISRADVRDSNELGTALEHGISQLGRLDIVAVNAGIFSVGMAGELTEDAWQDMMDINLTGAWNTAKVAIPHLISAGNGGSIIFTSSVFGAAGAANMAHYVASKHGVVGLMRSLALELTPHQVRVNAVLPRGILTEMTRHFGPGFEYIPPGPDQPPKGPTPMLDPMEISNAMLFLASDEARYMTGTLLSVDGNGLKNAEIAAMASDQ